MTELDAATAAPRLIANLILAAEAYRELRAEFPQQLDAAEALFHPDQRKLLRAALGDQQS
jgi:hypothetical protein